jgi:hypothetical protein
VNTIRRSISILIIMVVASASTFGMSGAASAQNSGFDCQTIPGLRVLDSTLKAQPDGGWAMFDALSNDCKEAYVAAQSVARVEVVTGERPTQESPESTVVAANCTAAWVSAYAYTWLDNVAYRYVFQDYFCFDGSTVTSHAPSHWIDNVDPNYYWRRGSVISEQWIGTGYWTEMQGTVENCVFQYGCIGIAYPGGWIQTYGSGYWDGAAWAQ